MTSLSITGAQRRAALEALGLDPDLTTSAAVSADWVTATVIETDQQGAPRVVDGAPVTTTVSGPIGSREEAPS